MKTKIEISFENTDPHAEVPEASLNNLARTLMAEVKKWFSREPIKNIRASIDCLAYKGNTVSLELEPEPGSPPMEHFHRCCFVCGRHGVSDMFDGASIHLECVASRGETLLVCNTHKYGSACRNRLERQISYLIHVKKYQNFPVDYRPGEFKNG